MTQRSRLMICAAALTTWFAVSSPVRAEAGLRLNYQAAAGCPSQADFVAAVQARGEGFDAGSVDPFIEVAIQAKPGSGFQGSLRVRGPRNTSQKREVDAASCTEVVDALAVVAAIALRSEQPVATVAPAAPRAADAPQAQQTPDAPQASDKTDTEPARGRRRLRTTGETASEDLPVTAGTLHFDNVITLTGAGGMVFGLIPGLVLPRYDLSLSRANFVTTPDGQVYRTGPIIRTRFSFFGKSSLRTADTTTQILGFSVGIDGCLSPLFDSRGWELLFCSGFGAGKMQLDSQDRSKLQIQSKSVAFATATLNSELKYHFSDLLHVGVTVGAEATLKELSAERRDGSQIFESSVIYGFATLGLGVRF